MTIQSTARWDDNTLMVDWYSTGSEDEAAYWIPERNHMVYDGYDDTYTIRFEEAGKPDAETALAAMIAHQNGY